MDKGTPSDSFGSRRIYYNNFASHLLNAYNPNVLHPTLPYRWSSDDWRALVRMIAGFGFNAVEFWLVPSMFCREGLSSEEGSFFRSQMHTFLGHAREAGLKTIVLCSLATVGKSWRTLCPNVSDDWSEIRYLWNQWSRELSEADVVSIFPGDPGACSRHGCTAETYIDRSADIASLVKVNLPDVEIELGTWGPPFFGWGIIEGPPEWKGEFVQAYQESAWRFSRKRAERSMEHLLKRLPDFPDPTSVAINLGFDSDGDPDGERSAVEWVKRIAQTHRVHSWDFSLTEGENAILPHYRFERLFNKRKQERDAASYSGGICFTMTPLLNQLSLYESAQSFLNPDADADALAQGFYRSLFGVRGGDLVGYLPLFEVVKDWGNRTSLQMSREEYHRAMSDLHDLLEGLSGSVVQSAAFHPAPEQYRAELAFFASLFRDLSAAAPDYDALAEAYWRRVYAINEQLPEHVDPRPRAATRNLIDTFRNWRT